MSFGLDYYAKLTGQQIMAMSDEKLKITLQNMAMHVNGRMKQIERAGLENISKAYNRMHEKFPNGLSSKGKTRRQMIKQIKEGTYFLSAQTGTVSGTREYMKHMIDIIGLKDDDGTLLKAKTLSKEEIMDIFSDMGLDDPDFWKLYRKVAEEFPHKATKPESEDLIQEVQDTYTQKKETLSIDKMLEILRKELENADEIIPGATYRSAEDMTVDLTNPNTQESEDEEPFDLPFV